MKIECSDEISEELAEQIICDDKYDGFNKEALWLEYIKEVLGMEKEQLKAE